MNTVMSIKLFSRWAKPSSTPRRLLSQIQKTNKPQAPAPSQTSETPQEIIYLSKTRKRMFVFAGLYKNLKDVPDSVSVSTFSKNMDRFRVRASILIMVISAIGAFSTTVLAKGVLADIEEERERRE
ncbi:uncharacterized protein LOC113202697 [Frankliniella occidentalis]|uniref:Uncharacterized protein LOC113202697 n=1 Tax=Frankliniella occidentalis TaxID=133901 RepID=A0A6J1RV28_FRAOC|nr:uncharacterized protein LOC113202697 [Frankliniella occidentalis]XP_026272845.1 uncharacterized protein LOC113202697 [Frankliniella occidentalis]XP_026272846.1 uncharacterized protein LOC113202697 [Frankliniella occidentalis]